MHYANCALIDLSKKRVLRIASEPMKIKIHVKFNQSLQLQSALNLLSIRVGMFIKQTFVNRSYDNHFMILKKCGRSIYSEFLSIGNQRKSLITQ